MTIKIVNGPNLNLLGEREPNIYGNQTFESYLENNLDGDINYFQSNVEGEIINELQKKDCDGIILNAGGYTHTSVAIRDCISAISTPVIEVHVSNITQRETFRHDSLISPVCIGCIFGFGLDSYQIAFDYFKKTLIKT